MPLFHYLQLRAFAHETEDVEKVLQALRNVASGGHLEVTRSAAEGGHGNRILILEGEVKSAAAQRALFASLSRDDPAGAGRLREELPRRVDENLNFYLRLDKQDAFEGRMRVTASDDAVTVRAKLRSFRKGPEASAEAVQALSAFLDELALRSP